MNVKIQAKATIALHSLEQITDMLVDVQKYHLCRT